MSHLRAKTVLVIQSHGTNRVGSIDKGERNLDFRARTDLRGRTPQAYRLAEPR